MRRVDTGYKWAIVFKNRQVIRRACEAMHRMLSTPNVKWWML